MQYLVLVLRNALVNLLIMFYGLVVVSSRISVCD